MGDGRGLRMVLVAVLMSPLWLSSAAGAGCGPPEIDIGRQFEVTPGDELIVRGRFWTDTCDDTGGDAGCGEDDFERGHPVQDIRLMLVPKGERDGVFLTEVDADENFAFASEVTVPDVAPGRYVIRDESGQAEFVSKSLRVKAE